MFYKVVYNTCYRILSNSMDAEDCMQESFMKAFDKIISLSDSSPEAWLKRIAINTSLDRLKQERLDWMGVVDETICVVEESPPDEDEIAWKVEQIKTGISKLSEKYRIIINLYLLEGYDHEEIAEILQMNESTVRSQYEIFQTFYRKVGRVEHRKYLYECANIASQKNASKFKI